jgi:uncharacterized protein with NRDE domain
VRAGEYNPAWLLIGDRRVLYYVELAADQDPTVRPLAPGIHVLENVALGEASVKADRVRSLVSSARSEHGDLWTGLRPVLADHTRPAAAAGSDESAPRREATLAACVHTDEYGTRSAALVRVPKDPTERPEMQVADGPPCTTPFVDVGSCWTD